jgi:TonB dependent receptor
MAPPASSPPRPGPARPSFHPATSPPLVIGLDELGNRHIRPERVREHEFGFDATAVQGRLQLGLTWYRRRTVDQIVRATLPPGLGVQFTNLGLTTQHGFEAELTARLLDTRPVSWDLRFTHSLQRSKLVDLGSSPPLYTIGGQAVGGYAEGYSLGARFISTPLVGYADANGDGLLAPDEVQLGNTPIYVGESTPPISRMLTTVLGLFDRRLRLSAVLEQRRGFTQVNWLKYLQCANSRCRAAVDRSTPLAEQAERVAQMLGGGTFVEPGDFTRLREVAVALDLPGALTRALRLRSATLSVAGRNLALWTDFTGPDPESASDAAVAGPGGIADGIPQSRLWVVRLDLGL